MNNPTSGGGHTALKVVALSGLLGLAVSWGALALVQNKRQLLLLEARTACQAQVNDMQAVATVLAGAAIAYLGNHNAVRDETKYNINLARLEDKLETIEELDSQSGGAYGSALKKLILLERDVRHSVDQAEGSTLRVQIRLRESLSPALALLNEKTALLLGEVTTSGNAGHLAHIQLFENTLFTLQAQCDTLAHSHEPALYTAVAASLQAMQDALDKLRPQAGAYPGFAAADAALSALWEEAVLLEAERMAARDAAQNGRQAVDALLTGVKQLDATVTADITESAARLRAQRWQPIAALFAASLPAALLIRRVLRKKTKPAQPAAAAPTAGGTRPARPPPPQRAQIRTCGPFIVYISPKGQQAAKNPKPARSAKKTTAWSLPRPGQPALRVVKGKQDKPVPF